jgi:hypothetical protein
MTPASRARSTSSAWLKAVSMMTGQSRCLPISSAADNAVHDGHLDVHDHQVGLQVARQLDGLLPLLA